MSPEAVQAKGIGLHACCRQREHQCWVTTWTPVSYGRRNNQNKPLGLSTQQGSLYEKVIEHDHLKAMTDRTTTASESSKIPEVSLRAKGSIG